MCTKTNRNWCVLFIVSRIFVIEVYFFFLNNWPRIVFLIKTDGTKQNFLRQLFISIQLMIFVSIPQFIGNCMWPLVCVFLWMVYQRWIRRICMLVFLYIVKLRPLQFMLWRMLIIEITANKRSVCESFLFL